MGAAGADVEGKLGPLVAGGLHVLENENSTYKNVNLKSNMEMFE